MSERGSVGAAHLDAHARGEGEPLEVFAGALVLELLEHLRDGVVRLCEPAQGREREQRARVEHEVLASGVCRCGR